MPAGAVGKPSTYAEPVVPSTCRTLTRLPLTLATKSRDPLAYEFDIDTLPLVVPRLRRPPDTDRLAWKTVEMSVLAS